MSDYRYVSYVHGEPLQPEHTLKVHQETVEKMCESLKDSKNWNLKIICMTHHLPSERSVDKEFEGSPLNYAFFSNLEPVIEKFKPLLWVHGHTHKPCDYKIGDTRVVANPLGYGFGKENKNFNESLIIEV
jgi:Icc-related predicted phosphoesterase